ncbi:MAG: DMT family transporter [Candidatus Berkelbacteria bacterium]|nr:DMT family transporter [Candidatus Berkelbacteria bacterium]
MFKQLKGENRGIYLALVAALISGVAVFLNKEGVSRISDSDVYTTLKNMGTAVIVICFFVFTLRIQEFKKLKIKDWFWLVLIGLVGGSVPFLLFFHGLSLASNASIPNLIHKTLFIWVSVMAVLFLKERLGLIQILALLLLLFGNVLILGFPHHFQFGQAEILILAATLIWAIENILAKTLLKRLKSEVVVFGRMFFGSIFLIFYLIFTHKISLISNISGVGWIWVAIVSAILFGYVVFWYAALKYAPVSLVASILVLASPLTSILESVFRTHKYSSFQIIGMIIIVIALILFIIMVRKVKWKRLLPATLRA